MGKTSRAILAGVGAGLTQYGQGMMANIGREEENARIDARLEKEDAFKERELQMREQESNLRQQAMERQADFDSMELELSHMRNGLLKAGDNMTMVADTYSKYLPDDAQWHYNDAATKEQDAFAVFDIGFRKLDPGTGEYIPDPHTGLPMEEAPPQNGGKKVFHTQDEFLKWKVDTVDPAWFLGMYKNKQTSEQALQVSKDVYEWQSQTAQGKTAQKKADVDVALTEARKTKVEAETAKLNTEAKQPWSDKLAKIRAQGENAFADKLFKQYGVAFSEGQTKRVALIYDDPGVRARLYEKIDKALDPDDPATREEFMSSGVRTGRLPKEFLEDLYNQAERAYKNRPKNAEKNDGWFISSLDVLSDVLF